MYFFYDDYNERRVNKNKSLFKSNGHIDNSFTNGQDQRESNLSKPQILKHRSRCNSIESKLKEKCLMPNIISGPVLTCHSDENLKPLPDTESSFRRSNLTINTIVSQLGSLEIVMEDTIKMDFKEISCMDSDKTSIKLDWPYKSSVGKMNLPSTPAISRRHSVSVTPSIEIPKSPPACLRYPSGLISPSSKLRPQRRRSVVWADQTKTRSLETVYFVARRSTSLDQIPFPMNWIREKRSNVGK